MAIRIYPNQGAGEVTFHSHANNELTVEIKTNNLFIRSVKMDDLAHYTSLFGNKEVMRKFATGQTKTMVEVYDRLKGWIKRWHERDPYSAMSVFKKDTNEFVGYVVLGHGDRPGESEMAGLEVTATWKKGYGAEAAKAMVKTFAPATVNEGFKLEGKTLSRIVATARPDNPASYKILEKLGMHIAKKEEKYGALRNHYAIDLNAAQRKTACTLSCVFQNWLNSLSTFFYNWCRSL